MSAAAILSELTARGVMLSVHGGMLDVDGPEDALTPEVIATLKAEKPEIIALLSSAAEAERAAGDDGWQPVPGMPSAMVREVNEGGAVVLCICCRRPIPDPVRDWWGGDPVHRECGERAWRREWQAVPARRGGHDKGRAS